MGKPPCERAYPGSGGASGGWPRERAALVEAQRSLAAARPAPWRPSSEPPHVAACFVCFPRGRSGRGEAGDRAWAAAAVARRHGVLGTALVNGAAGAPYEPGLLALREGPVLERAVRALDVAPDVVLVNAGGADHPRGGGLALHLGAVLGRPSFGVTDRPLLAAGAPPPGDRRGEVAPLWLEGREVARWVTTRSAARPLVVHGGWRVDLDTAVALALGATRRARTPTPLRVARMLARRARSRNEGSDPFM